MLRLVAVGLVGLLGGLGLAQDAEQPTVAAQMAGMLARAGSGHSPTSDEIRTVEALPGLTDAKVAQELEPLMEKALANPDAAVRGYGLAMLVGMQSLPDAPPPVEASATPDGSAPAAASPTPAPQSAANGTKKGSPSVDVLPGAYKSNVGKVLAPLAPAIAKQLVDDDPDNRIMAADALAGFSPSPTAGVYPALLAYLKRDDAVGPVGLEVVEAILHLGPVTDDTATAVAKYLHRSDQTPDSEANLVEAISAQPNQSKLLNKSVLIYMDADDASLRSRVILSLPGLDLTPQTYADTRARVEGIVTGGQDNLQVVNAAKSVAGCWTQVKMTTGCPVY